MIWRVATRGDLDAAGLVAGGVLDALIRAGDGPFSLGLSGGRAAGLFFRELVRQARGRAVTLSGVDFFWCDERCVPPDHADSNYRVARAELLDPLGISEHRIHRLPGELPPALGAEQANRDWKAWGAAQPKRGHEGEGVLDCAILGVGEDGHVASLFPGNLQTDLVVSRPFQAVRGPKPPPDRLTMGYGLLWEARFVAVLVTGVGKESVVRDSVSGVLDTPLGRVLRGRGDRDTWLVTVDAGG